tara:strand:+ start:143 stop:535 length:393 start_codon:yes stop_codon:yes gene_type:complete
MHFVFDMDGVICTPAKGIQFGIVEYVENCKPIANVSQFMHWLKEKNHLIVIWCNRPNDLAVKLTTETWLELNEIPYDRLLFDRPEYPVFVDETPANAKYFGYDDNVRIIAELFEEWKECITKEAEKDSEQ